MGKKRKFRKSLLSSAILAATLKTLSGEVVAGTCPLPNASGNVHVAPGSFCEGGVTVDSGTAVNDIGIEGKVVGNIVNDDGMSDFWMDFGTLDGSFINNGSAQDVHVANGSEIYADIRNNGDMRYLSITDGPGANTVVHGSIVNTGGVVRVHVEGMSTRVGGDIVNADGASVMNDIVVDGGAIVAGNIYNNGEASEVVVNRESSVEGDLISDGSAFGLAVLDGSSVGGDFVNNGDSFYFVADDGGTVGGSMINTGNNIYSGVLDGSTVVGDFGNEGFVDGVMMVSNATVQSNVYNETYNDGIQITDGSTVGGNVTNSGETGFMVTARSQIGGDFVNEGLTGHLGIYDSQIAGNVVNSDDSDFLLAIGDGSVVGGDLVNTDTGYIQDGIALLDGVTVEGSLINDGMLESSIQLVNGSSVGADLVNNGEVFVGPEGWQQLSDGSATVAGINVDAGSMVGGNIVNNDSLIINFPPPPPPLPDGTGPIPGDGMGLSHSLAGISVDRGSSVGDIINSGLIEVTAGLEHNGPEFADGVHANGIQVKSGSTSGSIINDGAILADTFGVYVDGRGNDGVTVNSDIINTSAGIIFSQDNGLYVHKAEVTGDIANAGVIHSSNDNGIDLEEAIVGGSVINSGELISNENYDALSIDDSVIAGDVVNAPDGVITGRDGIDIDDTLIGGSLVNVGTIEASSEGIELEQTNVGGDLFNTGLIMAGGHGITVEGEKEMLPPPPPILDGAIPVSPQPIIHYATIGGSFVNTSEIFAEESGVVMEYVDIADDFISAGTIEAGPQDATRDGASAYNHGVDLDEVNIGGNVVLGDISASGYGVNIDEVMIGGDVTGIGNITGIQEDAFYMINTDIGGDLANHGELNAGVDGLDLDRVTIGGSLVNTGDINSFGKGINLSDVTVGQNVVNTGSIESEADSAINLTGSVNIVGDFTNNGNLAADNHGILLESDVGYVDGERVVDGLVSIGGDLVNTGNITAGNSGIWASGVQIGGSLVNEGDITAEENALRLKYVTLGGGLANFGDLTTEEGDVINIDDSVINGNIENHGLLTVLEDDSGDGIDIDDSLVKGSVINFGEMNVNGTEGFDIDESVIEGSVVNAVDGVINARSDGFYIDDSHIKGDVVNAGTIVAQDHDGIDIEVDGNRSDGIIEVVGRIDGSLISTGDITAGDNGYELDGEWVGDYTQAAPDGVITIPGAAANLEIGGKLYSSGNVIAKDTGFDIELTSIGANGVLADGQANFENHGNVTFGTGSGMDILASSVAGDFINTGDLTLTQSSMYETGDEYRFNSEVAISPEGSISFESSGVDSEGNAWFVIRNASQSWAPVVVTGEEGNPVSDATGVGPGQEVFITTGTGSSGNYTLSFAEHPGSSSPAVDGELAVSAVDLGTDFQPAYNLNDSSEYQRGISFTGKAYGGEDGEQATGPLIRSTVGGNFVNTGIINSKDEGIYLEHAEIGGNFGNEGDITTEHATAIKANFVTIGGDFINTGHLATGSGTVYQEGDSYREEWGGTPSEAGQVVLESGGVDENGNQWFVVRNESDNDDMFRLRAADNGFSTTEFDLAPGQVIYVNAGQLAGDLELQHAWSDGVAAIAGIGDGEFVLPEIQHHGISLTHTTVGGHFVNAGDIDAGNQGVGISNVSIAGAFENSGNITAGDQGISILGESWYDSVDGVVVTDSVASIGGHFTNTGDIVSGDNGINLVDALVGGGFTNTGNITTSEGDGQYVINIEGSSQIGGDIVNSGNLAGGKGIRLHGESQLEDGVLVNGKTVTVAGGLYNHGNINSTNDAIRIVGVDLGGPVINTGDIVNTGSIGIDIDDAIINGSIENHGLLETTDGGSDALELNNTIVNGHIINAGTMKGLGTEGIDINSGTLVTGSILNTGHIEAKSDAIIMDNSHIQGSVINDGTILAISNDAIELSRTNVDGSVINNGTIRTGDNAFEIDGSSDGQLVIGGNLENHGSVFAIRGDGVTGSGSDIFDLDDVDLKGSLINTGDSIVDNDGFDIDDTTIGGSLLSSGSIAAGDDGYDIDDITIAGDWINSGAITAGDSGYDVEGSVQWHSEQEIPDGVTPGYYTVEPVTVGGRFVNTGDIQAGDDGIEFDLVSIGTNGVMEEDGSASFLNEGNITAGDGYAMKLEAATVAGDFINTGDLTTQLEPQYKAGDYYYKRGEEPSLDGQLVLTPVGTDGNGLTWFSVKNEGINYESLTFVEEGSGYQPHNIYVNAGSEIIIAMAPAADGSGNFVLSRTENSPQPGIVAASNADLSSDFSAPYHMNEELARGISLTSKTYSRGPEFKQVVKSDIGGKFLNTGDIVAVNEGIYLNETNIGGMFGNTGNITTEKGAAIDISANNVGGDFINEGDLTAGNVVYQEGDHYRREWDGEPTPEGEVVFEFKGYDENGDGWFMVRNESDSYHGGTLQESDGTFSTHGFDLESGQEIYVNAGQMQGELVFTSWNNSESPLNAVADSGAFDPEGRYAHGISLVNMDISGAFSNSGDIDAYDKGIYLEDVTFDGGLQNTGNVTSGSAGVELSNVTAGGGLLNTGDIDAGWEGLFVVDSTLSGGVRNEGDITAFGSGIHITNATLAGSVINTGDINVTAFDDGYSAGMQLHDVDGVGDFINSGTINAAGNRQSAGMGAGNVNMDGIVANTGTINSEGYGIALNDVQGATGLVNSGTIDAVGAGMQAFDSSINGDVVNTIDGVITSGDSGLALEGVSGVANLLNEGLITAGRGENDGGFVAGIEADGVTMNGMIANTGTIDASDVGIAGFDVDGAIGVINRGDITTDGYGFLLIDSEITGNIVNGVEVEREVDGETVNVIEGAIQTGYVGMMLGDLDGVGSITNNGDINVTYGDGATVFDSTLSGVVVNNGTMNVGRTGMGLYGVDGTSLINNGTINAGTFMGDGEGPGPESFGNGMNLYGSTLSGGFINNTGAVITAATDGMTTGDVDGLAAFVNRGAINAGNYGMSADETIVTGTFGNDSQINAGVDGLRLDESQVAFVEEEIGDGEIVTSEGNVINDVGGVIIAGDDGIRVNDSQVAGVIVNLGTVTAGENAIDIDESQINGGIANASVLTATDTAIDIGSTDADGNASVGDIVNTGTVTSSEGAAIRVAGATAGQVLNTGTLNGGVVAEPEVPVEPDPSAFSIAIEAGVLTGGVDGMLVTPANVRDLNYGNAVAVDYRDADSALNLANGTDVSGNAGIINGDLFGSSLNTDQIQLAAGELNGDIYDVENINITGVIGLNNNIFSFNNSSLLTVADTGSLTLATANHVTIQGQYNQIGDLDIVLDQNEDNFAAPRIDVAESPESDSEELPPAIATLADTSTITVSVKDRNIANFNPSDDNTYEVQLVNAVDGVTDNGAAVQSDSILFNYSKVTQDEGTKLLLDGAVADLGTVSSSGGADANASNALAALQGIDNAGLVELYDSNPDLYNAIYDGSEASLAALAEQIVASPENGIAAGQAAQAEAVNTILTRIAELRTGASGISAGDGDDADSSIRPDSLWIRAIYSDGEQDATSNNGSNFNTYSLRSKGFTLGADKDVSDTLTLGAGVSVINSTANEKNSSSSAQRSNSETDTYLGSLYAGWRDQDYFVDASVNFGKGGTDLKGSDWEADYDSTQLGLSVMGGKSFLFNNNDTLVEPRVGFNYTRLETDKYSYESSGENITIGSQNLETLELGIGVRFVTGIEVGNGLLLPEASVMAWHDFQGDEVKANVAFETGGGSFTYVGPEAEKNRYQAGVGVEYLMDNNFTLSVNYDHNWQDDFKADTVVAKLRYDF